MPLANQDRSPLYFVGMVMLLVRVFVAMGTVVTKGERLVSDIRAVHDIDELTSSREASLDHSSADAPLDRVDTLELRTVGFRYKGGASVISGIDAEFEAGRSYALMGESGAGKSTLADVLLGLLPPSSGTVSVNGRNLDPTSLAALRTRAILVEQQTRIFTGTFRENVLLGHEADDTAVERALDAAGLSQLVQSRPEGLNFVLEYQGANLSGGQRQRVGIARALVRSPQVLVLDEATSALDQTSRDRVLAQVKQALRSGVLILITHDPEVAAHADQVWTVEGGTLRTTSVA
jgi:ATP-binding cassette subfamily B protein